MEKLNIIINKEKHNLKTSKKHHNSNIKQVQGISFKPLPFTLILFYLIFFILPLFVDLIEFVQLSMIGKITLLLFVQLMMN